MKNPLTKAIGIRLGIQIIFILDIYVKFHVDR